MLRRKQLAESTVRSFERKLKDEETRLLRVIEAHEAERAGVRLAETSAERRPDPESAEGGSMAFEFEKELSVDRNSRDLLMQVRQALELIEEGKYGNCLSCARPIPVARLRVIPHTAICVACASRRR